MEERKKSSNTTQHNASETKRNYIERRRNQFSPWKKQQLPPEAQPYYRSPLTQTQVEDRLMTAFPSGNRQRGSMKLNIDLFFTCAYNRASAG